MRICVAFVLSLLLGTTAGCATRCRSKDNVPRPTYVLHERAITVDGDPAEWLDMPLNAVGGQEHLWFGQGMTPEKWAGNEDLSYSWRGACSGDKLFFLIEVTDDRMVEAGRPSSFLCDCVEIYVDYKNRGGQRVCVMDGRANWFDTCDDRELMGYELHFLPTQPPRVYLDHRHKYRVDKPQNETFERRWHGKAVCKRTTTGYILEAGFSIPKRRHLKHGAAIGLEIGVCDDDGNGRESIMMLTGTKADFWLRMDEYAQVTLMAGDASR